MIPPCRARRRRALRGARPLPGTEVTWLGPKAGPVTTDNGLTIVADAAYAEMPDPDVVLVPGGYGTDTRALDDERLVGWIRRAHETSD